MAAASYLIGAKRGDIRVDIALASIASFLFGILMAFTIVPDPRAARPGAGPGEQGKCLAPFDPLADGGVSPRPTGPSSAARSIASSPIRSTIGWWTTSLRPVAPCPHRCGHLPSNLAPAQEEVVYKAAVEICVDMGSNRALIEAASGQSLSAIEWTGLLLLLLLLMSLIAVLPGGTLWGALVVGSWRGRW